MLDPLLLELKTNFGWIWYNRCG